MKYSNMPTTPIPETKEDTEEFRVPSRPELLISVSGSFPKKSETLPAIIDTGSDFLYLPSAVLEIIGRDRWVQVKNEKGDWIWTYRVKVEVKLLLGEQGQFKGKNIFQEIHALEDEAEEKGHLCGEITATSHGRPHALLGREILNQWVMQLDGSNEELKVLA